MAFATELRRHLLGGGLAWTIVAAPNPGWARQVFGTPDVERLWSAVGTALRLDDDDLCQTWWDHSTLLQGRARALTAKRFDAVRYHGNGTDLTVGLDPRHRWVGGATETTAGSRSSRTCPPRRSSPAPTGAAPTVSCASPVRWSCPGRGPSSRISW